MIHGQSGGKVVVRAKKGLDEIETSFDVLCTALFGFVPLTE